MDARNAQFVMDNRAEIISKVSIVEPIADELQSERVIRDEAYSRIIAARTTQSKMRELYIVIKTTRAQCALYRALREHEPDVVKEIEERTRSQKRSKSTSMDEKIHPGVPKKKTKADVKAPGTKEKPTEKAASKGRNSVTKKDVGNRPVAAKKAAKKASKTNATEKESKARKRKTFSGNPLKLWNVGIQQQQNCSEIKMNSDTNITKPHKMPFEFRDTQTLTEEKNDKSEKSEVCGYIHDVTEMREGRSGIKYFHAKLQGADGFMKIVGFEKHHQIHQWLLKAEENRTPVKLQGVELNQSKWNANELEIKLKNSTVFSEESKLFFNFKDTVTQEEESTTSQYNQRKESEARKGKAFCGYIHSVTKMNGSGGENYFYALFQKADGFIPLKGFTQDHQKELKEAEKNKTPIKLQDVEIQPGQDLGQVQIMMNDNSKFIKTRKLTFEFRDTLTLKEVIKAGIQNMRVNVTCWVVEETKDTMQITRAGEVKRMVVYIVEDETDSLALTVWDDDQPQLYEQYKFKNVSVVFYKSQISLSTTKDTEWDQV